MKSSLRGLALACAVAALFTASLASEVAAECPAPSDSKPATAPDLEVTTACTVGPGAYYYGNVNIHSGGSLTFTDAKIDFWARAIIVEKDGALIAGAPPDDPANPCGNPDKRPIGCANGVVTIHLWGAGPASLADRIAGVPCKLPRCGVPESLWIDNPTTKTNLPGGVSDYFYRYFPLDADDLDPEAYYGTKVLGVGYEGTLKLFGKVGSTFCPNGTIQCDAVKASNSGTSWARLDGTIAQSATQLRVDRPVPDWLSGDPSRKYQIVVTTTDYLPGHSELLEIQSIAGDRTIDFKKCGDAQCKSASGGVAWIHNGEVYDLEKKGVPTRLGLEFTTVETRAAVALLSRSIRIVSGGPNVGDPFPDEPLPGSKTPGEFFGGHTVIRQGFRDLQVQGVEFYQLGQGGRLAHYPIHFHLARKTSSNPNTPRAFVKDSAIHDSMTRWITLHGTHSILLERNVGYRSIGHGFYLEDGTEINNTLHSNLGIYARAAIMMDDGTAQRDNPRMVPGILAALFNPAFPDNVPFYSDYNRPVVFWIMNGWNDFEGNMAAGAGTCGMCYWLVPGGISGHSLHQTWESYASLQYAEKGMLATTPLKKFSGNYCSTAQLSFNTVGNSGACNGLGVPVSGDVHFVRVPNPLADAHPVPAPPPNPACDVIKAPECPTVYPAYYPKVDQGGGRFATPCSKDTSGAVATGSAADDVDCSAVAKCANGNSNTNCAMTVLDGYTSAFHWAEHNFGAIWLRPQWYVVLNSALSDVQAGGLGFVSGGDYSKSSSPEGNLMLVRKSVFIGNTQDNAANPLASNAGPFVPNGLTCDNTSINYCLSRNEGITMQLVNFAQFQRLFTIYDGPAHQDSNAYLDITPTLMTGCTQGQGNCVQSPFMYGRLPGVPWDPTADGGRGACYLPNAAIAWKQSNGFYYPPSFHSTNLYFHNVGIRHYVVEPLFTPGTRGQDDDAVRKAYCTFTLDPFNGMFGASFSAVDRQTILNDDDGSLTGYATTISVNEDRFFTAPVETTECRSAVLLLPEGVTGTAKTSPYEYVTTAVYPDCAATGCGAPACRKADATIAECCKVPSESSRCDQPVSQGEPCMGGSWCLSLWSSDCTNQSCFGVPLYRQLVTASEKAAIDAAPTDLSKRPSIQMAAMNIFQRSNLTADNGIYYIDTTPNTAQQREASPNIRNLNVFQSGQTYYVYQIFAKPHTKTTYQLYVGPHFDKDDADQLWAVQAVLVNKPFTFTPLKDPANPNLPYWPSSWIKTYADGILTVTMNLAEFGAKFTAALPNNCRPGTFCTWTDTGCRCAAALETNDPQLYEECIQDNHRICSWTVTDIDCPDGGCFGFAVKLPAGFPPGQLTPPTPIVFPQSETWSVAFSSAGADVAGECAAPLVDFTTFSGVASNVGGVRGTGLVTMTGTFTAPAGFSLAGAQNVTINLLLHEPPGQTSVELVEGFGPGARRFPLNLVRTNPGQSDQATFVTGKTVDNVDISPRAQLKIAPSGGGFSFDLRVDIANITAATNEGCPRSDAVTLVSSFGFFGSSDPIDVGVNGKWDCHVATRYTGSK